MDGGFERAEISQLVSDRADNVNVFRLSNLTLYCSDPVAVTRDKAQVFREVLHSYVPNIYLQGYI